MEGEARNIASFSYCGELRASVPIASSLKPLSKIVSECAGSPDHAGAKARSKCAGCLGSQVSGVFEGSYRIPIHHFVGTGQSLLRRGQTCDPSVPTIQPEAPGHLQPVSRVSRKHLDQSPEYSSLAVFFQNRNRGNAQLPCGYQRLSRVPRKGSPVRRMQQARYWQCALRLSQKLPAAGEWCR